MNSLCSRPAWMISRAIALARAMSEPTSRPSQTSAHCAEEVVEEDRMRLAGVAAPQDDEVRLLRLTVGAGAASGTEDGRQTGDRWGVSGPVAAVDVVAAQDDPAELLGGEVDLVGRLAAAEDAERLRPVGRAGRAEAGHGP